MRRLTRDTVLAGGEEEEEEEEVEEGEEEEAKLLAKVKKAELVLLKDREEKLRLERKSLDQENALKERDRERADLLKKLE